MENLENKADNQNNQASEVQQQWEAFYDNVDPESAKQFRELFQDDAETPATESKPEGTEESEQQTHPVADYIERQYNVGGIGHPSTSETPVEETTPPTAEDVAEPANVVEEPDSQPTSADTVDQAPTPETHNIIDNKERIERNNQKLKDVVSELIERGEAQPAEEQPDVAEDVERQVEDTTVAKKRGQKVLSALSQRRVDLAQRRAHHARVETFDSSYHSPETTEKTPISIRVETPEEPAASEQPEPEQPAAVESNENVSDEEQTPVEPEQNAEMDEHVKHQGWLKDVAKELAERENENAEPALKRGELSERDLQDIVAKAQRKTELSHQSIETLQSDFEEDSKNAKVREIILRIRNGETLGNQDLTTILENNTLVEELNGKSTGELELEAQRFREDAHLKDIVIRERNRNSAEAAA